MSGRRWRNFALQATIEAMQKQSGSAIAAISSGPHPDDEFVEARPGDIPVGTSRASGFQRRDPDDILPHVLGDGEIGDDVVTD